MAFLEQFFQFVKDQIWIPSFMGAQIVSVAMVPLGLPGLWVQVALAAAVTLLTGHIGWWWTALLALIALGGELLDAFFGQLGFSASGASNSAACGAFVCGFIFAFFGGFIPIPLLGSVIMSFIGTFVGAILGEVYHQKRLKPGLQAALGAVLGRASGVAAKLSLSFLAFGVSMFAILIEIIFRK